MATPAPGVPPKPAPRKSNVALFWRERLASVRLSACSLPGMTRKVLKPWTPVTAPMVSDEATVALPVATKLRPRRVTGAVSLRRSATLGPELSRLNVPMRS